MIAGINEDRSAGGPVVQGQEGCTINGVGVAIVKPECPGGAGGIEGDGPGRRNDPKKIDRAADAPGDACGPIGCGAPSGGSVRIPAIGQSRAGNGQSHKTARRAKSIRESSYRIQNVKVGWGPGESAGVGDQLVGAGGRIGVGSAIGAQPDPSSIYRQTVGSCHGDGVHGCGAGNSQTQL